MTTQEVPESELFEFVGVEVFDNFVTCSTNLRALIFKALSYFFAILDLAFCTFLLFLRPSAPYESMLTAFVRVAHFGIKSQPFLRIIRPSFPCISIH